MLRQLKIEAVDPANESELISEYDAETFRHEFDALKNKFCQKLTYYKQKFDREAQMRLSLEGALRDEVTQRMNLNQQIEEFTDQVETLTNEVNKLQRSEEQIKELTDQIDTLSQQAYHRQCLEEQIKELTDQVKTLSKENSDSQEKLRQNQRNIKHLQDELNLKELQVNELNKQNQRLLKEKASFNKNFADRLTTFLNDVSFSDVDGDSNILSYLPGKSDETDNKRSNAFDASSIQEGNDPSPKRLKTADSSSPDPNVSSTFDLESENEMVVETRPDSNDPDTRTKFEHIETNAAANRNASPIDSVRSDWQGNPCSYLDVVINEDPLQIRHCQPASSDDLTSVRYKNPISNKPRSVRRNIKKIMGYEKLSSETKHAYQQEKERKKQYARRLQKYNETYGTLPGELNNMDQILLDFDLNTQAELLAVDRRLSIKLKPHQCEGVKFMWDACFESIEKLRYSEGSGCILSHCMGLGKTLQVITLAHTLLTHRAKTNVSKVLIICPVNVILNWVDEFEIWLKSFPKHESINVFELASNPNERTNLLKYWHLNGGVLIIGYKMFQMIFQHMERELRSTYESSISYQALIDPGADLVVCDEGHLLKNPSTQISATVNKIRTLRRIVLTGTPLQNNLKEYFAMVEFVKPRLLGTETEFNNRFVGPIVNGQFVDSTDEDITLMKYRAYILNKLLEGCVHRRDYSVLSPFLPPKQEYVLFIRLTKNQIRLYKYYMMNFITSQPVTDLPPLRRICNHPMVLVDFENRHKSKQSTSNRSQTDTQPGDNIPDKLKDWWSPICSVDQLEMSNKMLMLSTILSECEMRNEKLVVFSGCLSTLNVIEHFLKKISEANRNLKASSTDYKGVWKRDLDYSRLDGSQSAETRKRDVTRFNRENNTRTRLFLISTKAGSLGINLMAASRVIIFDASWNPSDDIQSIFRVYRIGQVKKCFIYRFISLGTMEEKIYDRQISKLSIAKRVIDKHQIGRHYREEDLQQLYSIDSLDPPTRKHSCTPTGDDLLNSAFQKFGDIVYKYHDHDSLLENVPEETVTEEDVGDFWDLFE